MFQKIIYILCVTLLLSAFAEDVEELVTTTTVYPEFYRIPLGDVISARTSERITNAHKNKREVDGSHDDNSSVIEVKVGGSVYNGEEGDEDTRNVKVAFSNEPTGSRVSLGVEKTSAGTITNTNFENTLVKNDDHLLSGGIKTSHVPNENGTHSHSIGANLNYEHIPSGVKLLTDVNGIVGKDVQSKMGVSGVLYNKDGVTVEGNADMTHNSSFDGIKGIGGGVGLTARNSEGTHGGVSIKNVPGNGTSINTNVESTIFKNDDHSLSGALISSHVPEKDGKYLHTYDTTLNYTNHPSGVKVSANVNSARDTQSKVGVSGVLYKNDNVTIEGHGDITHNSSFEGSEGIGGGVGLTAENSEGTRGGVGVKYVPGIGPVGEARIGMKSGDSTLDVVGTASKKESTAAFEYGMKFGGGSSGGSDSKALKLFEHTTEPLPFKFENIPREPLNIPTEDPYKSTKFSAHVPSYMTIANRMPKIDLSSHFNKDHSNIGRFGAMPESIPSRSTSIFSRNDPFKSTNFDVSVPVWRTVINRAPKFDSFPRYNTYGMPSFPGSGGFSFG